MAGKSKHVMLRKLTAGIMLTCFVVFILGQASIGVSASSMLIWSSVLMICLGIGFQILLKVWTKWQDISDQPTSKQGNR